MRINQAKRIFMNEEGSSPGGGAAPPAPPAPTAEPTAPPALDADSLISRLVGAIDEKFNARENAFFANARKAGLLGKDKPTTEPTAAPAPQSPPAPAPASTGLSAADVESMLEQERVITRAATEHKLTDAQVKRMKSALKAERPEDIGTWTGTYLTDMGLAKAATPPAPATQPATPPAAKPNLSDRGTASPVDLRDSDGILNSRPLEMTSHDYDSLLLKHGEVKGQQMFQDQINAALRRVRIKPPGRG